MYVWQYRMAKDFRDPKYLGPRIMDKMAIALIIMTLCEFLLPLAYDSFICRLHASKSTRRE